MPITVDYPHVGFRRRLDGQQEPQYAHLAKLNHAWLARVARVRKLSRREFAEYTNAGFEAVAGVYCCWLPVDLAIGERCGEKARCTNAGVAAPSGVPSRTSARQRAESTPSRHPL